MAIILDRIKRKNLAQVVGQRLRGARQASGLSQRQAADALGHKEMTQISLAESGQRLPPLVNVMRLADTYRVPTDYLLGRIDDPDLEGVELRLPLLERGLGLSLDGLHRQLIKGYSRLTLTLSKGSAKDRAALTQLASLAQEGKEVLRRVRELNPEFDELKGGAHLLRVLADIEALGRYAHERTRHERHAVQQAQQSMQEVAHD